MQQKICHICWCYTTVLIKKGQCVSMNIPYCCLLRRQKAHKIFEPYILHHWLCCWGLFQTDTHTHTCKKTPTFLISIFFSWNFVLILLPTSLLPCYPILLYNVLFQWRILLRIMKTKTSNTYFSRVFWRLSILRKRFGIRGENIKV